MAQKKFEPQNQAAQPDDTEFASEYYSDYPTRHVMSAIQEMYSQAGVSDRKNEE